MKIRVEKQALLTSLAHGQAVVEKRNTIPILSNILIQADRTGLKLTATDLDVQIEEMIAAEVKETGSTTVSAHTFHDIVRKLPDGAQVELTINNERLEILSGRSRFELAVLTPDDFPVLEVGDWPHNFTLPCKTFKDMIEKVRFAISTEESRFYLNGIYMHVASDKGLELRLVATDGHRLARIGLYDVKDINPFDGVIIPRKAVGELVKLLDEAHDKDVIVSLTDRQIRFEIENATLTSKLIDGKFPDYNRVIPTGNDRRMVVKTKQFFAAVDRVATITSDRTRAVRLNLEDNLLTLSVTSPETGMATEDVPADYEAQAMQIGFNSRYLMDVLGQISSDEVEIDLSEEAGPTIIRTPNDKMGLFVLMPMRV